LRASILTALDRDEESAVVLDSLIDRFADDAGLAGFVEAARWARTQLDLNDSDSTDEAPLADETRNSQLAYGSADADDPDRAAVRAWELFVADHTDETRAEIESLLPALINARLAVRSDDQSWHWTAAGVARIAQLIAHGDLP
jgi:hypothetical protein